MSQLKNEVVLNESITICSILYHVSADTSYLCQLIVHAMIVHCKTNCPVTLCQVLQCKYCIKIICYIKKIRIVLKCLICMLKKTKQIHDIDQEAKLL